MKLLTTAISAGKQPTTWFWAYHTAKVCSRMRQKWHRT